MNKYFLTGFCEKERLQAVSEIEKIIAEHGFIIDFKMFSDISISIMLEIEERKIEALYDDLKNYMNMQDMKNMNSGSDNESLVLLNVTFTKGSGNLTIEVPSVPG